MELSRGGGDGSAASSSASAGSEKKRFKEMNQQMEMWTNLMYDGSKLSTTKIIEAIKRSQLDVDWYNTKSLNHTFLMSACMARNTRLIKYLLTGVDELSQQDGVGNSELKAKKDKLKTANPAVIDTKGLTAFMHLLDNRNPPKKDDDAYLECVDLFINYTKLNKEHPDHFNITVSADDGTTYLVMAAMGRSHAVIKKILAAGADINAADVAGDNALMCAAKAGRFKVAALLVKNGADIQAENKKRDNILHHARVSESSIEKKLEFILGFMKKGVILSEADFKAIQKWKHPKVKKVIAAYAKPQKLQEGIAPMKVSVSGVAKRGGGGGGGAGAADDADSITSRDSEPDMNDSMNDGERKTSKDARKTKNKESKPNGKEPKPNVKAPTKRGKIKMPRTITKPTQPTQPTEATDRDLRNSDDDVVQSATTKGIHNVAGCDLRQLKSYLMTHENDSDINSKAKYEHDRSPLMFAVLGNTNRRKAKSGGVIENVKFLVLGDGIKSKNHSEKNEQMKAKLNPILKKLDINAQDSLGNTALHYAVKQACDPKFVESVRETAVEIVKILLQHPKIDLSIQNKKDRDVANIAEAKDHKELIGLFKENSKKEKRSSMQIDEGAGSAAAEAVSAGNGGSGGDGEDGGSRSATRKTRAAKAAAAVSTPKAASAAAAPRTSTPKVGVAATAPACGGCTFVALNCGGCLASRCLAASCAIASTQPNRSI